jgi:hypothetical protein
MDYTSDSELANVELGLSYDYAVLQYWFIFRIVKNINWKMLNPLFGGFSFCIKNILILYLYIKEKMLWAKILLMNIKVIKK